MERKTQCNLATAMAGVGAFTFLLAACSDDPQTGVPQDPADVSGAITVWTYPLGVVDSVEWWDEHVAAFNTDYPDVEVEVVMQSWESREEALVTAVAGQNAPDVVYFNPDFIPRYAEEDLLLPLDDLRDDWDTFVGSSLEAMSWQDTLYGAPLLMSMQTSYCNTEALEQAGVECPTTWDEFRDAAPALVDAGYYATEYYGNDTLNLTFYPFLWQAGGEVLSEDMQTAAFNGPEGLEALELLAEMAEEQWVPTQALSLTESLEQTEAGQGNVGYVLGANLTEHRTLVDSDLIETVPPMAHSERIAAGSVGGWSVFNSTDSPEAAQAWVHHLSDEEFMTQFLSESGYLPPREDIEGLFADDPQVAQGMEYLEEVRVGVMHPQAREIIDTIRPHIQSVLLEGADPQGALDAAEREVNDLLGRG